MDWSAVEDTHTPKRRCSCCNFVQFKSDFAASQWSRKDQRHHCKTCVQKKIRQGTPLECTSCHMWQAETAFDEAERKRGNVVHRTCSECTQKRPCKACGLLLPRSAFSSLDNWKHPERRKCDACLKKDHEQKPCILCGSLLPRSAFSSLENWKHPERRKCDACLQKKRGYWTCMQCKTSWAKSEFCIWLQQKNRTTNNGRALCNSCLGCDL